MKFLKQEEYMEHNTINLIKKAIAEKKLLTFDYVSMDLKISYNRLIEPLKLTEWNKRHFLIGKDKKANEGLRQFELEGVNKLELIEI